MRDVTPPAAINAEIVSDIPVKDPLSQPAHAKTQLPSNPLAKVFRSSTNSTDELEDKVMDHVLRDVNSSVKRANNSAEERFEHLDGMRKKVAVKKAKMKETRPASPPIVATVVACLVALILTAATLYVYRQG